jgi:hypothetical protein
MKRVTLLDNAGGNALGWTPDDVASLFAISEPTISDVHSAFPIINVLPLGGDYDCFIDNVLVGSFLVFCNSPPGDGAQLHYVIENLPPHIP